MKNKNQTAKEKRGFTTKEENDHFVSKSDIELISLLNANNPKDRNSSATILGQRKSEKAVSALCNQLKNEMSLYSKIAIQNALANIGEPAMPKLIKLVGKIGNNQHKELPKKRFEKSNYPCARDIAIRTICKIGLPALRYLQESFETQQDNVKSEIIDGIGHISFYSRDTTSFKQLINNFNGNSALIKWKIIRALSAFPTKKSEIFLIDILTTAKEPELKWEAERSLSLIHNKSLKDN